MSAPRLRDYAAAHKKRLSATTAASRRHHHMVAAGRCMHGRHSRGQSLDCRTIEKRPAGYSPAVFFSPAERLGARAKRRACLPTRIPPARAKRRACQRRARRRAGRRPALEEADDREHKRLPIQQPFCSWSVRVLSRAKRGALWPQLRDLRDLFRKSRGGSRKQASCLTSARRLSLIEDYRTSYDGGNPMPLISVQRHTLTIWVSSPR